MRRGWRSARFAKMSAATRKIVVLSRDHGQSQRDLEITVAEFNALGVPVSKYLDNFLRSNWKSSTMSQQLLDEVSRRDKGPFWL